MSYNLVNLEAGRLPVELLARLPEQVALEQGRVSRRLDLALAEVFGGAGGALVDNRGDHGVGEAHGLHVALDVGVGDDLPRAEDVGQAAVGDTAGLGVQRLGALEHHEVVGEGGLPHRGFARLGVL